MSVFGVKTSFPPRRLLSPSSLHMAWPRHRPPFQEIVILLVGDLEVFRPISPSPSLSGSEIEMSPDYGRKDARADRMQHVDWILTICERNCISQTAAAVASLFAAMWIFCV